MISINEATITSSLIYAINNMLSNLLFSINENIYDYLDELAFLNSDVANNLSPILGTNSYTGINLVCNSLIYGFIIYYAISYLLSHLTFSQVEKPFQFIFKLILCAIALNASHFICSYIISFFANLSEIVFGLGHSFFKFDISFSNLVGDILPRSYFISNSFSLFSFDGILKTSITFGFLNLSVSYAIRYILIKVFIVLSPFAILSLASNKTNWFFKTWFKTFFSLLFLQVFVAIILLVCFIIGRLERYLPTQVMHLGMVYTLFKANSFIRELVGGFSTDVSVNMSTFSNLFRKGVIK